MKKKVFYFDVETTGLNPVKNDIVQLAFIIEIDGEEQEKYSWTCQPFDYTTVTDKALEIQGRSIDEIRTFQDPKSLYRDLIFMLDQYVDKYNKFDKFTCCGYNCQFDIGFLKSFFKKNDNKFFGSYFQYKYLDPYMILFMVDFLKDLKLKDHKLATAAEYYNIPIKAHDALSDIEATKAVWNKLIEEYIK